MRVSKIATLIAAGALLAPAAASSTGASKGLGLAALVFGALGLLAGLAALIMTRRARTNA